MPTSSISPEENLRAQFNAAKTARINANATPQTGTDRLAVRLYQQARMHQTHADLLASADTGPAAKFFLTELYSTGDLTQRDAEVERVMKILVRFLPKSALTTLAAALEMDAITESVDSALAHTLRAEQGETRKLRIDAQSFEAAYRLAGNYAARERQYALTQEIGESLQKLARMPLLLQLLRVMRGPALAAGVGELHDFLENGYAAFKQMKNSRIFLETVVSREKAEHARIISG